VTTAFAWRGTKLSTFHLTTLPDVRPGLTPASARGLYGRGLAALDLHQVKGQGVHAVEWV
jgi:hypothetical protein